MESRRRPQLISGTDQWKDQGSENSGKVVVEECFSETRRRKMEARMVSWRAGDEEG